MILPSFFAFTCFDCFACTLPVSFAALGDPVCPVPMPREGISGSTIAATQRLRPTSGPKHFGTRSRVDAHAHGEACLTESYRPWGVPDTKAICPLILGARRPRLRRGVLQQRRIVPKVSKNAQCWESSEPSRGSFPPWSFLPMGVGEQSCQRFTGVWRSRLPPQSFLPVGIGEATSLVTCFDFFDFISLHSLSYLWVSGR